MTVNGTPVHDAPSCPTTGLRRGTRGRAGRATSVPSTTALRESSTSVSAEEAAGRRSTPPPVSRYWAFVPMIWTLRDLLRPPRVTGAARHRHRGDGARAQRASRSIASSSRAPDVLAVAHLPPVVAALGEPGALGRRRACGRRASRSATRSEALSPWMMATMAITVMTPMTMPSVVRKAAQARAHEVREGDADALGDLRGRADDAAPEPPHPCTTRAGAERGDLGAGAVADDPAVGEPDGARAARGQPGLVGHEDDGVAAPRAARRRAG